VADPVMLACDRGGFGGIGSSSLGSNERSDQLVLASDDVGLAGAHMVYRIMIRPIAHDESYVLHSHTPGARR